jgi:hypothetical protein
MKLIMRRLKRSVILPLKEAVVVVVVVVVGVEEEEEDEEEVEEELKGVVPVVVQEMRLMI